MADFADDGVIGGDVDDVLRVLRGEIAIAQEYGLRYNYSKMVVYPMAGEEFVGDVSEFQRMGITVDYSGNVKFMQVPVVGNREFIAEWVKSKMGIIRRVLEGLRGLSSRHVALYLLKGAGDACRVVYYLRTTPAEMIRPFVGEFDAELRRTFEEVVGLTLSEDQWLQCTLGIKNGGMGVCCASRIADAAYLASRAQAHEDSRALDESHVWDDGSIRSGDGVDIIGEWLLGATDGYDVRVPECSKLRGRGRDAIGKQGELVKKIEKIVGQ
eukprot:2959192-Karenia_brevis.AAC.1